MPPFIGGGHMISRVDRDASTYAEPPTRFEAGTSAIAEVIGQLRTRTSRPFNVNLWVDNHDADDDWLASEAFDAHVAQISLQQNDDMRKISAWVAIAAVSTLVAGVYGMNFQHMPELEWQLGYPFALLLMALTVGVPLLIFWRKGWLR